MKTYAQALGINKEEKEPKLQSNKQPDSKKNNVSDSTFETVIKRMEKQIEQLTAILTTFCEVIVQDENVKKQLAKRILDINQPESSNSESNQTTKKDRSEQVVEDKTESTKLSTNIDKKGNDRKHLLNLPLNVTGDMKGVLWVRNNKKRKSKENIEG